MTLISDSYQAEYQIIYQMKYQTEYQVLYLVELSLVLWVCNSE